MKTIYIISSASVCDGKIQVNETLSSETYEDAIIKAQDSIAYDFGYDSWDDYLSHMDPAIEEKNGVYTIHDGNCEHEESYRIERFVIQ